MSRKRQEWVATFKDLLAVDPPVELFEATIQIASPEYPTLRPEALRGQLDAWARAARSRGATLSDAPRTPALLASVCHVLFKEVGLKGNREDYTDPRNSFVNEVIERRTGLPITLSLIFMEVARRVGLSASGVAFPGHFLARVEDPQAPGTFVVVDSFAAGNILGVADLHELLTRAMGAGTKLSPSLLAPAAPTSILVRILRNLKATYTERNDFERALLAQERILVLCPEDPGEIRDHGLLLARASEPGAAVRELERYLSLSPDANDEHDIQRTVMTLKSHAFSVN